MSYLLDVNVLLALVDRGHAHHKSAVSWFRDNRREGWSTCPITQNGFVRILSHPRHPSRLELSSAPLDLLEALCGSPYHLFWSDDIPLGRILPSATPIAHRHITDLYLLGLAVQNGGRLATFDRRIPAGLVAGGPDAHIVLPIA